MTTSPLRTTGRRGLRIVVPGVALVGVLAVAWWSSIGHPTRAHMREARVAVARGQAYLKRGRPDLALRVIGRVSEDGPWEAEVLAVKGLALAASDRPEEARPILERSLKLDSSQSMPAKVLAAVYFHANETERGFRMLQQASRLDPDDFRPWSATGEMMLRYPYQPENAARAFREALRRRPDHEESRMGLADALLATGAAEEAAPLVEGLLRDRPRDSRVFYAAALLARFGGRTEDVVRYTEQALAIDPDHAKALVLRAQSLQQSGRPKEALGHAERAVALAPDDPASLSLLAVIEGALGLEERSAATSVRHRGLLKRTEQFHELGEAAKRRPDDPEPRWRMGRVAAEGGMTDLAIRCFRAALALDPSYSPAREGLAALGTDRAGAPPSHAR